MAKISIIQSLRLEVKIEKTKNFSNGIKCDVYRDNYFYKVLFHFRNLPLVILDITIIHITVIVGGIVLGF